MANIKAKIKNLEKLDFILFWFSVLGCIVALAVSFVTHDRETSENSYLYVVFVIPAVMLFAALVAAKLRREKQKKKTT